MLEGALHGMLQILLALAVPDHRNKRLPIDIDQESTDNDHLEDLILIIKRDHDLRLEEVLLRLGTTPTIRTVPTIVRTLPHTTTAVTIADLPRQTGVGRRCGQP
jgi:hypothetical protein